MSIYIYIYIGSIAPRLTQIQTFFHCYSTSSCDRRNKVINSDSYEYYLGRW